jgi:putative zinc finger/helix-turn-helix YgiT family protein
MEKKEMAYCESCRKKVPFTVESKTEEVEVRGLKLKVKVDHCFCAECKEEVEVNSITEANIKRALDAYKKAKGLLSSDEIRALRQRYGMSAVEFARAIGAGEKTITRYENGAIQDEVYDKFLRLLNDNVAFAIFAFQNHIFSSDAKSAKTGATVAKTSNFGAFTCDSFLGSYGKNYWDELKKSVAQYFESVCNDKEFDIRLSKQEFDKPYWRA